MKQDSFGCELQEYRMQERKPRNTDGKGSRTADRRKLSECKGTVSNSTLYKTRLELWSLKVGQRKVRRASGADPFGSDISEVQHLDIKLESVMCLEKQKQKEADKDREPYTIQYIYLSH